MQGLQDFLQPDIDPQSRIGLIRSATSFSTSWFTAMASKARVSEWSNKQCCYFGAVNARAIVGLLILKIHKLQHMHSTQAPMVEPRQQMSKYGFLLKNTKAPMGYQKKQNKRASMASFSKIPKPQWAIKKQNKSHQRHQRKSLKAEVQFNFYHPGPNPNKGKGCHLAMAQTGWHHSQMKVSLSCKQLPKPMAAICFSCPSASSQGFCH